MRPVCGWRVIQNDYTGYMPNLRVLKEGGYEAAAGWAEDVEDRIAKKVHELHAKVSLTSLPFSTRAAGFSAQSFTDCFCAACFILFAFSGRAGWSAR